MFYDVIEEFVVCYCGGEFESFNFEMMCVFGIEFLVLQKDFQLIDENMLIEDIYDVVQEYYYCKNVLIVECVYLQIKYVYEMMLNYKNIVFLIIDGRKVVQFVVNFEEVYYL